MDSQRFFELEYRHTLGTDFRADDCWHLLHGGEDGEPVDRPVWPRVPKAAVAAAVAAVVMLWVLVPAEQLHRAEATPGAADAVPVVAPGAAAGPHRLS